MKVRPLWKALPTSPGRVRAHLYTTPILIFFIHSLYSITVFVHVPATLSSLRVILVHFLQRQPRVWACVSSQEMLRELRRLITSRSQETMFEEILMKIMMGHDSFWHPHKVNRFEPLAILASDLSLSPMNIHFQVQVKSFTCYFDLLPQR